MKKLLGKGDEGVEREWEEGMFSFFPFSSFFRSLCMQVLLERWLTFVICAVLKEIEQEDSLWHRRRKEAEEKHEQNQEKEATTAKAVSKNPVVPAVDKSAPAGGDGGATEATKRKVGFF
jgi:hypothetical protein